MAHMETLISQHQKDITNLKQTKEADDTLIRTLKSEIQEQSDHLRHKDQVFLAITEQL